MLHDVRTGPRASDAGVSILSVAGSLQVLGILLVQGQPRVQMC